IEKQGGNLDIAAYSTNKVTTLRDHGGVTVSRRTIDTLLLAGPPDETGSQHLFVLDGSAKIDVDLFAFGGKYQHKPSGAIYRAYSGRHCFNTPEGPKNDITVTAATRVAGPKIREPASSVRFILPTGANLTEIGDIHRY